VYADLCNFLLVVQEGTITGAARAAHLTQPALTASIQRLEGQVGGALFVRGRKGAVLTDAGRALLPHARAARGAVEEGRAAVAEVLGLGRGEVTLGAGATACTWLLPSVLVAFQAAHPGLRTRLREASTPQLLDGVRSGTLDLAIATRLYDDATPWALSEDPWRDDPLVLVEAPGEARAQPPYLASAPGSPLRTLLDRHFPGVDVCMELWSIPAVLGNVAAGIGVGLVPRAAAESMVAEGRLAVRSDPRTPTGRALVLVHRGVGRLSVAAAALRGWLLTG